MTILIAKCEENGTHAACLSSDEQAREEAKMVYDEPGITWHEAPEDTKVSCGPCSHFPLSKALATDLRTIHTEK